MLTTNTRQILRDLEQGRITVSDAVAALQPGSGTLSYLRETWVRRPLDRRTSGRGAAGRLLLLDHDGGVSRARSGRGRASLGEDVILVQPGGGYAPLEGGLYAIDFDAREDYDRLFNALSASGAMPDVVVHLWSRAASADDLRAEREPTELLRVLACTKALLDVSPRRAVRQLYVYSDADEGGRPEHAAMSGFLRSLNQEHPSFAFAVIRIAGGTVDGELPRVLDEANAGDLHPEVMLRAGDRFVNRVERLAPTDTEAHVVQIRRGGAYLITGGTGGLGQILASALAQRYEARLILASRSGRADALPAEGQRADGGRGSIRVLRADVTSRRDVARLLEEARAALGGLNGIIHAAGVTGEGAIASLGAERAREAIAVKARGARLLDEESKADALDFFVMFSSMAATLGSAGQAAYAYANRYMDSFARWRANEARRGARSGASLSINWPYWRDGGMRLDEGTKAWMKAALGIEPLTSAEGVRAFEQALALGEPGVAVLQGDASATERLLNEGPGSARRAQEARTSVPDASHEEALRASEQLLRDVIAKEARLPPDRIRLRDPFECIGIDSVMIKSLTRRLEAHLGPLPKTLFFEHQTLEALRDHLATEHAARLLRDARPAVTLDAPTRAPDAATESQVAPRQPTFAEPPFRASEASSQTSKIAIIGVAGRYPMANSLEGYWENLRAGRDCISEIPADRWDHQRYWSERKGEPGKSYSRWGGFIEGVDEFDPLFFRISPAEARLMDPQERLFLQVAWHAIEDAGFTKAKRAELTGGVFVGVMYGHYQLFGVPNSLRADGFIPNSSYASIANRVSYVLDLHGPSMAVDTMCSSSLTAIHLAIQSILAGECDFAIAGGVNLSIHPSKYQMLSQGHFASSDGRCRSFGEGGDGYVPGEGVGAVVLKPLERALRDRDPIYGSILATAVNHGGKTNGYTVPNPKAQAEVIARALERAKVDAFDVSYVEAHGTGTALGDPVEIAALSAVFGARGALGRPGEQARCRIGSVKSNVGHMESAAGVAALTKVLWQFRHRELVPSIHSEKLNPHIDFERSAFVVQRALEVWDAPPREVKGAMTPGVRRAGISSFGAGGANAHLIVEEFVDPSPLRRETSTGPEIVVLSARDESRLREYAESLRAFLSHDMEAQGPAARSRAPFRAGLARFVVGAIADLLGVDAPDVHAGEELSYGLLDRSAYVRLSELLKQEYGIDVSPGSLLEHESIGALTARLEKLLPRDAPRSAMRWDDREGSLADIAYTLQTGREPMASRLAIVATDIEDLVDKLGRYCRGEEAAPGIYVGRGGEASDVDSLFDGEAGEAFTLRLVEERDHPRLARLWCLGANVSWAHLQRARRGEAPRLVRLPTYPFARERTWLDTSALPAEPGEPRQAAHRNEAPRPAPRPRDEDRVAADGDLRRAVEAVVRAHAADLAGLSPEQLDPRVGFPDLGLESVKVVKLTEELGATYGIEIPPAALYEHATVRTLARHLVSNFEQKVAAHHSLARSPGAPRELRVPRAAPAAEVRQGEGSARDASLDIAIIGASGRFPRSEDLEQFWENLRAARDMIGEVPSDRWDWTAFHEAQADGSSRSRCRWGGFLADVDKFDARFFRISSAEAAMMDPQQRLFLETVWKTIEDAGYKAQDLAGRPVGVFAGVQFNDYRERLAQQGEVNPQVGLGNEHSILVNRVSYFFDFRGPSEPFNTACSSSLVALHRAISAIRGGECELAIVGGVSLMLSPMTTLAGEAMGILSPDGRCKTLDASANGYVRGEGVGALLLKPLDRALADGDNLHAVIKATAVNHGGKSASLTAPRAEAQSDLLVDAYLKSGIDPDTVGFVELHGTGTKLGDPIEIEGLKSAFRRLRGAEGEVRAEPAFCAIGTVKTNIGHLEPAAGIAGVCKAILALRHQTLPGLVHFKELNPYIDLKGSPFFILEETQPWKRRREKDGRLAPLRCGVSSFGFGGVNAHVVLEEAPNPNDATEAEAEVPMLVVLSARSDDRLREHARRLAAFLRSSAQEKSVPRLCDVSYTLLAGREAMEERLALWASSLDELQGKLTRFVEDKLEEAQFRRGRCQPDGHSPAEPLDASQGAELATGAVERAAESWVEGRSIEWRVLYPRINARRISLPTYPFECRRHWALREPRSAVVMSPPAPTRSSPAVPDATRDAAPKLDAAVDALRRILAEQLKEDIESLDTSTVFADVGVDSIMASSIIEKVRSEFGEQIPVSAIFDCETIGEFARWLEANGCLGAAASEPKRPAAPAQGGARSSARRSGRALPPELVTLGARGDGQSSFWIHGGTGLAALYNGLARTLAPDFPVYALQARGFDGKSVPRGFEEMVSHYIECIRMVQRDGPYVIGGYSSGGVIAYEVARRIHVDGGQIKRLIMFDTVPSVPEAFDTFFSAYGGNAGADFLILMTANELAGSRKRGTPVVSMQDIAGLLDSRKAAHAAQIAARAGRNGLSADDMFGFIRGSLELGAVVEEMYMQYRAEPYEGSGVTYFRAREFLARENALGMVPREVWGDYDYVAPWRHLTKGEFEIVHAPCDHFNMLEEPVLKMSAAKIREILTH